MDYLAVRFALHFKEAGLYEAAVEAFGQVEGAHFLHFICLE